ncbi:MAG: helicase-associated domain-containing protein [Anaerolineales bacterium]|nr:helicase-associated domain-containing protein [Anaerolineales bacterium]
MPDLFHSLLNHDIGHIRIIAGLWGLELESNETDSAREELSASLLDFELVAELMDSLSPTTRTAITTLVDSGGRIAWSTFTRQYGDIREMGAGKRDRERPHLKPASIAEALFYRGLLARAFFDTEKGPQEFAYIPDDLLAMISHDEKKEKIGKHIAPLGRDAIPAERAHVISANDHILDDATTLLAALRMGRPDWGSDPRLCALLTAAKLINKNILQAEVVKKFLEAPRADALVMLVEAWRSSSTFNELRLIPGILCEGEWTNAPLDTRNSLFGFLETIPRNKRWNLNSFVKAIKEKHPDFQRPASDYDSWFIKRSSDGLYLRGFEHWDEVDGALIRYFITDILHWLGQVDLGFAESPTVPTSFRITTPDSRISNIEIEKLHISSQGRITSPRLVPRAVRYQLARFCEWDDEKPNEYRYHITPRSLTKAKEAGLKVEHLLPLLAKHSGGIPPVLVKALKRWEVNGTEARAETQIILRVSRPEVLEELRRSTAARFLGEVLSPTTVIVKSGAIQKVMEAMTGLGLLTEDASTAKAHKE